MQQIIWQAHPSWRGMASHYVKGLFLVAVIGALAILAHQHAELTVLAPVAVILLGTALVFGISYVRRHTTTYTITKTHVIEKAGILNTKKEQARVEKITNITVERSLAERALGIGRINIDTANDREDILQWWGINDPYEVERTIDQLRLEAEDELSDAELRELDM